MRAVIRSIATANPPLHITQAEAFASIESLFDLAPEERELYRRLLLEGTIQGRYVGMHDLREIADDDRDRAHERFLEFGRATAVEAATETLRAARVNPADICALVTNTCTGYLCPGMSSYLVEDLGLSESTRVFDLMGMGCGGALPNLDCAVGALRHGGPVLSVSFEVCSATLMMGNSPDLIVSNSIFGDGAAAVLLDREGPGLLRIIDFESGIAPKHREALRYRWEEGRLRNVLNRRVPAIGAREIHKVAMRLLHRNGLDVDHIKHWAVHAGGTVVLDRVAEVFGLEEEHLAASREIFCEYGNMSSPSVLFSLRRIIDTQNPQPGDVGILLSFGAGFTAFAALIAFENDTKSRDTKPIHP
jgi:predicted naringenin-chalcone synthase